jgi:hypothetical protein
MSSVVDLFEHLRDRRPQRHEHLDVQRRRIAY